MIRIFSDPSKPGSFHVVDTESGADLSTFIDKIHVDIPRTGPATAKIELFFPEVYIELKDLRLVNDRSALNTIHELIHKTLKDSESGGE